MSKSGQNSNNKEKLDLRVSRKNTVSSNKIKADLTKPIRSISADIKAQKAKKETASINDATAIQDYTLSIDTPIIETKVQKTKRSLKLNLDSVKPQEVKDKNIIKTISYIKDTSVNQNSPFFYKPSIFEKFDIDVCYSEDIDESSSKSENIIEENDDNVIEENIDVAEEKQEEVEEEVIIDTEKAALTKANSQIISEMLEDIKAETNLDATSGSPIAKFISNDNKVSDFSASASSSSFMFKNITFDDTFNKNIYQEAEKISPIDNISDTKISSILEEAQNNDVLPEISASSNNVTLPSVDEINLNDFSISEDENNEFDMSNVFSAETTIDDISIDDIDINDISLDDIELEDFESADESKTEDSIEEQSPISNESLSHITTEDLEELESEMNSYDDNSFSIEKYFGIDKDTQIFEEINKDESYDEDLEEIDSNDENIFTSLVNEINEEENKEAELEQFTNPDIVSLSTMIKNFTQTISTLNDRISELENGSSLVQETTSPSPILENKIENVEEVKEETFESNIDLNEDKAEEFANEIIDDEIDEDINIEDLDISDLEISDSDLADFIDTEDISEVNIDEPEESYDDNDLLEQLLNDNILDDEDLESSLLTEAITDEVNEEIIDEIKNEETVSDASSDFFKILDTLSKTISDLEDGNSPILVPEAIVPMQKSDMPEVLQGVTNFEDGKEINILMNEDDIFSISILNETYEIVADFSGISVISENIHISTPKNNFYIKVGNKYIEIHNKQDYYLVQSNFEDVEFTNAINNVGFAKKDNKIELNIKETFKLSSINNKLELSMVNSGIVDLGNTSSSEEKQEDSIHDNRTLLISEETQKVYLPYTMEEVMKKLNDNNDYQTVEEVIANEYTIPLSTFKVPVVSRFKEAYKFMREKEKSSRYAAVDLGLELMFNSNLNPAIIRASKNLKELNVYLDCLYENEVEKFDCFKIVYKVLPKIQ